MTTEEKSIIGPMLQSAWRKTIGGEYHEAIYEFTRSIEICPCAEAYAYRGWALSFIDDLENAIKDCRMAITLDPDLGNGYNDLGAYYIRLGRFEEAIPYLEKAIVAKRYNARHFPHQNLGYVFELQGRYFEALGEYRRALKIHPEYTLAQRGLDRVSERIRKILKEQ